MKPIIKLSVFQSPQWGSNSKAESLYSKPVICFRFSPRNGEVILKLLVVTVILLAASFSPRNGEVILKRSLATVTSKDICFSPRNGEVILKGTITILL